MASPVKPRVSIAALADAARLYKAMNNVVRNVPEPTEAQRIAHELAEKTLDNLLAVAPTQVKREANKNVPAAAGSAAAES